MPPPMATGSRPPMTNSERWRCSTTTCSAIAGRSVERLPTRVPPPPPSSTSLPRCLANLRSSTYVISLRDIPDSDRRRERSLCALSDVSWRPIMYRQVGNNGHWNGHALAGHVGGVIAQSGQLDALIALERIGRRHTFSRNAEIYAEGGIAD